MKLVLASSSPYRKALLSRLQIDFACVSPDVDETSQPGEPVEDMVKRLAQLKARAVAGQVEDALVIGSDQSALLKGEALSKPGNHDNAVHQLKAASGQRIVFNTGLCVINTTTGNEHLLSESFTVVFRKLDDETIEKYLKKEQPYNCAGSFKSEGLGIMLVERFEGDDPNTLVGLPMIKLIEILEQEGVKLLD